MLMKWVTTVVAIAFVSTEAFCQTNKLLADHEVFRSQLLTTYRNLNGTSEERAHLSALTSLPFFPFDSSFRVKARLDTSQMSGFTGMKTSLGRLAMYRRFGNLTFTVAGQTFTMPVYQARSAVKNGSDELFFPFTDDTNGETTYGGGRYVDLHIPKGNELILDFNRAFNPYCAYSHSYSCEIPPKENHFPVAIEAGVKY
jgi:uncharacterized protein (DUF1684 family)